MAREPSQPGAPGDSRWDRGFFERIVDAGFVVAAPDYRFSGEAVFPAQRDDVVEALRWLVDHAGELGTDPARLPGVGRVGRRTPGRAGRAGRPTPRRWPAWCAGTR